MRRKPLSLGEIKAMQRDKIRRARKRRAQVRKSVRLSFLNDTLNDLCSLLAAIVHVGFLRLNFGENQRYAETKGGPVGNVFSWVIAQGDAVPGRSRIAG